MPTMKNRSDIVDYLNKHKAPRENSFDRDARERKENKASKPKTSSAAPAPRETLEQQLVAKAIGDPKFWSN